MSALTPAPGAAAVRPYSPGVRPAECVLDLAASCTVGAGYPDSSRLVRRLAQRFGVTPDRVLVTAGADEAIDRCCRAVLCSGTNAVLTDPTFEMLPRYVTLAGAEARWVPWPSGPFPAGAVSTAADARTALVAVVTPNNPTGAVAAAAEVKRVHEAVPQALVVVDLAYVEFADLDPTLQLLELPRVVVVRTLSKAWGLAGARIGFAIGSPGTIALLKSCGGPYPVSEASLAVAAVALDRDQAGMRAAVRNVRRNRGRLTALLTELGEPPLPSQASFVCLDRARARWIGDALGSLGIATRLLEGGGSERLRIGVPHDDSQFAVLERALRTALTPEALIFDMDGVLADVSGSYRAAIRLTAERFGVALADGEVRSRKALGNANDDWALATELIAARGGVASLAEVKQAFEEIYQGTGAGAGLWPLERLLIGRGLLASLSARYRLAVVTGRPRTDAERFLWSFGVRHLFAAVVAREDAPLKPDPAPVLAALAAVGCDRAWMLGDSPDDVVAARRAGVVPIGVVAPGEPESESRATLRRAGAALVVREPGEVAKWLR